MSRIGSAPILIPDGVKVEVAGNFVGVTGSKGEVKREFHPSVKVRIAGDKLLIRRMADGRDEKSIHGLSRSLLANMVMGVSTGFEKAVEMRGIGYRAQVKDKKLVLNLGHSHSTDVEIPDGITIEVVKKPAVEQLAVTQIVIRGVDKEKVGKFAAGIRQLRPPEPYKGKGVRNIGEYVRRKAGKKAA
jgi:large subunit ribosomal protein L6